MPRNTDTRTDADILSSVEQVMNETIPDRSSRRSLMTRAGGVLAAGAALALPGAATADAASRSSIVDVLATFETFGVRQKSPASAVRATEALGIGIGERGRAPGRFYTYGGDPRKNGTGAPVTTPKPS